jgi:hypothetical protein
LLGAFEQRGELVQWKAEAVPDAEERTNLDAWWCTHDGLQTFCEVKLCEGEFGKCKADAEHQRKLSSIYRPRLIRYVDDELLREDRFFQSYQILRNIWHLTGAKNAELIFLMPKENVALWKELNAVLRLVNPVVRARVKPVSIESVLEHLIVDPVCPRFFVQYAAELKTKYIPPA